MSIINPSQNPVVLKVDTIVATVHDVEIDELQLLTDEFDKNDSHSASCSNINIPSRDETDISFDLSKSDLTEGQKESLTHLLE